MSLRNLFFIFLLFFVTACGVENNVISIQPNDNITNSGNNSEGDSNNNGSTGGDIDENTSYYTINFYANLGEGSMQSISVIQGESVQLPVNEFTRNGFIFKGWASSSSGSLEYNDKDIITPKSDMDLYAVWEAVSYYTITLHSGTVDDESIVLNVSSSDMPYKLPKNTFVNGTKKFTGWQSDNNDFKYIDGFADLTVSSNINLYASWYDNPVTISFNPVGGTGDMPNIYAAYGDKIMLPKADFIKEGYELKGTYTFDLVSYAFGSIFTVPNKDVDLYTVWIELPKPADPVFGGNSEKYKNITLWVAGVNVREDDWVATLDPNIYDAVWRADAGWYDTTQGSLNLCWAATASNLLHWWQDRNKANIDKYFNEYTSSTKPVFNYLGFGGSEIFNLIKSLWPDKNYFAEKGIEWFLIGLGDKEFGAYYKDVFYDNFNNLIESYPSVTQYSFNTRLVRAFENNMAVTASERNAMGSHEFTIWGAHFDDKGFIDKIYYSDSATPSGNNTAGNKDTGLSYIDIDYDNVTGRVNMKTRLGGLIPVTSLTLFSDGAEQWKTYFDTHTPIK